jgi:hypothetical protein
VALLSGLLQRFMDAVELQELAVARPHLLFDVPVPQVGREAEGAVGLLIYSDVIRPLEPDDVIALGFVFVMYPCR